MKTSNWIRSGLKGGRTVSAIALAVALSACGSGGLGTFQKLNACQSYSIGSEVVKTVRAPVDVLFVVDNSGSMSSHQIELQTSFSAFSSQYLTPDASGSVRDLRMAVITTDTYFAGLTTGGRVYPVENAKLLPGYHDGEFYSTMPIPTPSPSGRSGHPILSSIPADGSTPTAAYLSSLNHDFMINANVGIRGNGNESGMASLKRFLDLNETSCLDSTAPAANCFFRKSSNRVIFFMSDSKDYCTSSTVSTCMHGSARAADVQTSLESYLHKLDGSPTADSKLFSIALVAETDPAPNDLEIAIQYSTLIDLWRLEAPGTLNSLGQYSKTLALGKDSISDALNAIGQTIEEHAVSHSSVFNLSVEAASVGQTDFYVVSPSKQRTAVPKSSISLQGSVMSIDAAFINQFPPSSTLEGCYLPKN